MGLIGYAENSLRVLSRLLFGAESLGLARLVTYRQEFNLVVSHMTIVAPWRDLMPDIAVVFSASRRRVNECCPHTRQSMEPAMNWRRFVKKRKASGKPTNDCGSSVCQHEVGPKPAWGRLLLITTSGA